LINNIARVYSHIDILEETTDKAVKNGVLNIRLVIYCIGLEKEVQKFFSFDEGLKNMLIERELKDIPVCFIPG